MSKKFTGFVLAVAAIALLVHAFILTSGTKDEREAAVATDASTISVAISQFDLANGINREASNKAAASSGSSSSGSSKMTKLLIYGEVAAAIFLGVIGVAMVASTAMRTAHRIQVNATRPYGSFDSCVFSGSDFSHFNHRGRLMNRGAGGEKDGSSPRGA
jgi:hypothetical protein